MWCLHLLLAQACWRQILDCADVKSQIGGALGHVWKPNPIGVIPWPTQLPRLFDGIHGSCSILRPYECLWSVLSPETMCKSMIHVPLDCKGKGSYFCSGINASRLTVDKRSIEGICDNLYSPPTHACTHTDTHSSSLGRKPMNSSKLWSGCWGVALYNW